jgi:hypothetical protein
VFSTILYQPYGPLQNKNIKQCTCSRVLCIFNGMDSLQDLLGRYKPQEPEEILAIKRYIYDTFQVASSVGIQGESIVITVASASLANTLRFHVPRLQAAGNTGKRIILRIG